MELLNERIGFALCGSFCTFSKALDALEDLCKSGAEVYPIMSEISYKTDTRFGKAEDFCHKISELTGRDIIKSIKEAEPIGPKKMLDLLIVAPCTGNTLAKIASGITDSSVTMAVKAHLRNNRPVLLAVSTNDGLGNAAKNIGMLMNSKNFYFVPLGQDDYEKKPNSLVADFYSVKKAAEAALEGRQLQPLLFK